MLGFLTLLIPVLIVAGILFWVRRSRAEDTPAEEHAPRRIPLVTEAIGYIGSILVLAGGGTAIGQAWNDLTEGARLGILGGATVLFLAIGLIVRTSDEPAFKRLNEVVWLMSTCGFAGSMGVLNMMRDTHPETAFLTIATASTAYAVVLWALTRRAIQHVAMFAGVLLSASSILVRAIEGDLPGWVVPTTLWAIGIAWTVAGWTRRLEPWWAAAPIGAMTALIAPASIMPSFAWKFTVGIATASALMAFSVAQKVTPGLALGSLALLGYVIGTVTHYFGDSLGVPAALAITGGLILVLAAVVARLLRSTRTPPPATGEQPREAMHRKAS